MGLVLESPSNVSVRSWNFLGYDVGGDTMVQMPKCVEISSDFVCMCEKVAGSRGSTPYLIVPAVYLYI